MSAIACIGEWPTRRVGITGSRYGHPDVERWMVANVGRHGPCVFVLGGNETGKRLRAQGGRSVDERAREVCDERGWPYVELPALWSTRLARRPEESGAAAGGVRNTELVEWVCSAFLAHFLAFPCPKSSGTWECAGKARQAELRGDLELFVNWRLVPDDPRRTAWGKLHARANAHAHR